MEQPLVSIALCTYNGEKFLREQLDSLVYQTYSNLEIIAVDDRSADSTLTILKEYEQRFNFVKLYQNEKNLGYVKNFERAISLCSGDLIALSDQDDIWNLKKIEKQVLAIGHHQLIYHDSDFIDVNGALLNKKMSDVVNMYEGDEPRTFLFFNCVSGHSIMVKKESINASFPLQHGLFHDRWIAYVATNLGSIGFINESLVKYRQHENSDTNILKLSRKEKANYIRHNATRRFQQNLNWFKAFKDFPRNKNPELMKQFYAKFLNRTNSAVSFGFAALVFKHRKLIFFVRKKSTLNKLYFIFKLIWGLKVKSMSAFNK
jgi:glycosyltransferase involved in cell wall biosynthesis